MNSTGAHIMRRIVLALVLAFSLVGSVSAQTYLGSTTLTNAVTASQTTFVVGSVGSGSTAINVGGGLYVDREYVTVRSISGLNITVTRGTAGTTANSHGAARTIIVVPLAAVPLVITSVDPVGTAGVGSCTVTDYQYQPIINVTNGNVWLCRYTAAAQTSRVWAATNNVLITYNSLLINLQ